MGVPQGFRDAASDQSATMTIKTVLEEVARWIERERELEFILLKSFVAVLLEKDTE